MALNNLFSGRVGEGLVSSYCSTKEIWVKPLLNETGSRLFNIVLSDNCSNKTARDRVFNLGMAPKEDILPRLFNSFTLKILVLYLDLLWSPLTVGEKSFTGERIYGITWKHTLLTILFIFNILWCFYHCCHFVILISLYLIINIVIITKISTIIIFIFIVYYCYWLV